MKIAKRFLALLVEILVTTIGAAARPPATIAQRWALTIDSRDTGQWLSVRGGFIYCVRDAHVIAIDLRTGHIRWTSRSRVEGRPAIGGRTVYAPLRNGVIALDARTGYELGRAALPQTPELVTADFAAIAIVNAGSRSRFIGFRGTLDPLWQREFGSGWGRPEDVGQDTILVWENNASVIALDARNGNVIAATDGVEDYVGRENRTFWFSVAGVVSKAWMSVRTARPHFTIASCGGRFASRGIPPSPS